MIILILTMMPTPMATALLVLAALVVATALLGAELLATERR